MEVFLLLKIGEFSQLGQVSIRTLRHYDEIDLLHPQVVDEESGYRYYSVKQLRSFSPDCVTEGASSFL